MVDHHGPASGLDGAGARGHQEGLVESGGGTEGGAHGDWDASARSLAEALQRNLDELSERSPEDLLQARYEKYGKMGAWAGD